MAEIAGVGIDVVMGEDFVVLEERPAQTNAAGKAPEARWTIDRRNVDECTFIRCQQRNW
jgi:hypothetical protein